MKYLSLLLSLLFLAGCGGQPAGTASSPVPASPAPPSVPPSVPPPPASLPASYVLTPLPPVEGGTAAQAQAINSAGVAAGYSVVNGRGEATLWRDGVAIDLGEGFLSAINDAGTAAGYVSNGVPVATLWPGGSIGTLAGYDSSIATGIDADGTVVGVCFQFNNPNQQQGFSWTAARGMQAIPQLQSALAISHGRVAGIGLNFDAAIQSTDLGFQGVATAINSHGDAAGFVTGQVQAFIWNGSVTDLGTAGTDISTASGINDSGIVVGLIGNAIPGSLRLPLRETWSLNAAFIGTTRAMAWTAADGIVDLNSRIASGSGWAVAYATGINGSGAIVGAAVSSEAGTEGFMLVPVPPQP